MNLLELVKFALGAFVVCLVLAAVWRWPWLPFAVPIVFGLFGLAVLVGDKIFNLIAVFWQDCGK